MQDGSSCIMLEFCSAPFFYLDDIYNGSEISSHRDFMRLQWRSIHYIQRDI